MESIDNGEFTTFIHEREVAGQPVNLIGDALPVGRTSYKLINSTGTFFVDPDPVPP
jgi:hypothetical protein